MVQFGRSWSATYGPAKYTQTTGTSSSRRSAKPTIRHHTSPPEFHHIAWFSIEFQCCYPKHMTQHQSHSCANRFAPVFFSQNHRMRSTTRKSASSSQVPTSTSATTQKVRVSAAKSFKISASRPKFKKLTIKADMESSVSPNVIFLKF